MYPVGDSDTAKFWTCEKLFNNFHLLGQRITQKAELGKESTHLEKKILNNAKPKILQIPHILFGSFAQLAKTVFEKRPYQASEVRGVGHHIFS